MLGLMPQRSIPVLSTSKLKGMPRDMFQSEPLNQLLLMKNVDTIERSIKVLGMVPLNQLWLKSSLSVTVKNDPQEDRMVPFNLFLLRSRDLRVRG